VVQALRFFAFGTGIAYGSVKLGYLKVRTEENLEIKKLFQLIFYDQKSNVLTALPARS